jgi:hypothetical protein
MWILSWPLSSMEVPEHLLYAIIIVVQPSIYEYDSVRLVN